MALGEAWAREAFAGLVIGLTGELGAGKTHLVKGLARGLGVTARVTSPSFTLVHEYRDGRLPLFHLDLFRLETPAQVLAAGLEEYLLDPHGVTVVEWVERWLGPRESTFLPGAAAPRPSPPGSTLENRPPRYRQVLLESLGERARRICYEDSGA